MGVTALILRKFDATVYARHCVARLGSPHGCATKVWGALSAGSVQKSSCKQVASMALECDSLALCLKLEADRKRAHSPSLSLLLS